jgi:predicted amidohydrolase YtcJ
MTPLFLFNTRVFDPSQQNLRANAMLIDNGLIVKMFTRPPHLGKHVQKVDLHGSYLIPGFIDSHTHLVARGLELQNIDFGSCSSLDECLTMLRSRHKDCKVINGSNWDESTWKSFQPYLLTRQVLDRISKTKPVIMRRVCGHCAVVNTAALRAIPAKLKIINWKTGWLYEDAALYLNDIFKPDKETELKAVKLGMTEAVRHGITSIHEIGDLKRLSLLQHAHRLGLLRTKIAFYVLLQDMHRIVAARFASGFGDDFLKFAGIKIFTDGSIGARTAAITESYKGTHQRGRILITSKRLASVVQNAERHRLQLMIHTIGDRATARVIEVLKKYMDPQNRLRHRLEHVEILDQRLIDAIARLDLIASMQPNFVKRWQHPGGMYERSLGQRYCRLNCFNTMYKSGVRLAFGSDCMPLGPLYGIAGACDHPFSCGRISRLLAFRMYTHAGAFATSEEKKKGRLAKGMTADLVVLNKDPRTIHDLDSLNILMTLTNGKIVFRARS